MTIKTEFQTFNIGSSRGLQFLVSRRVLSPGWKEWHVASLFSDSAPFAGVVAGGRVEIELRRPRRQTSALALASGVPEKDCFDRNWLNMQHAYGEPTRAARRRVTDILALLSHSPHWRCARAVGLARCSLIREKSCHSQVANSQLQPAAPCAGVPWPSNASRNKGNSVPFSANGWMPRGTGSGYVWNRIRQLTLSHTQD